MFFSIIGPGTVLEFSTLGRSLHRNHGRSTGKSHKNTGLQLQSGARCSKNFVA